MDAIHFHLCSIYSICNGIGHNLPSAVIPNTLSPKQNGCHFPDNTLKYNFLIKFVPKNPFNNISTLVPIMAWHQPGDKPLSETMMVKLLMHICITWPQWVCNQKPEVMISAVMKTWSLHRNLRHVYAYHSPLIMKHISEIIIIWLFLS